jgi:EpsI family protein
MLLLLLLFTSIASWRLSWRTPKEKNIKLIDTLSRIDGWKSGSFVMLDPNVVAELKLDDYLNKSYLNKSARVHLYIGYYLTAEKIGAAHDPLVCFPGQGWTVGEHESDYLEMENGTIISYASMIVERSGTKKMILYWFQAHDKTNSNTFQQKVDLISSRISGRGEENAFVRISSEIGDRSIEEVRKAQFDFIRAFYPSFIQFIGA